VAKGEEIYEETVRVKGKEIINGVETARMVYDEDDYDCMVINSGGVKQYKGLDGNEYHIFNPPKLVFPNIEIGEDRKYSVDSTLYNIEGLKMEESSENGKIMLESIEEVKIPAGRFNDCLKFFVASERKDPDGSHGKAECTIWLAPGVGKILEQCTETEYGPDGGTDTETSISKLFSYDIK